MTIRKSAAAAVAAAALLVACKAEQRRQDGGNVRVQVSALTDRYTITRIAVDVQPGNVQADLTYDAYSASFAGQIVVPAGPQTVTARAYSNATLVGEGSAAVDVTEGEIASVSLTILDTTGPGPKPDHSPIIASFVVPRTKLFVGDVMTLTSSARDPDGDAVTYQWSQSCAGTFSAPNAPVTDFSAAVTGACQIVLTVTANGLTAQSYTDLVVLQPGSGSVRVNGQYVANPHVFSVSASSNDLWAWVYDTQQDVLGGTVQRGEPVSVHIYYTLSSYDWVGQLGARLTDDCGGSASIQWITSTDAWFTWRAPTTDGLCVLRAEISHEGLADSILVGLLVNACSSDSQCGYGFACVEASCALTQGVKGTRLTTYWTAAGQVSRPATDLANLSIDAYAYDPIYGNLNTYPGSILADGTFTIPGVPSGRYLLSVWDRALDARTVIETAERTVDLGIDVTGRADATVATLPTPITFDVTGLEPWVANDQIQLTGIGADVWDVPTDGGWAIPDGAATFSGAVDWSSTTYGFQGRLVDAALGDSLWVHQNAWRPLASDPVQGYLAANAAAELTGVVMRDGQPLSLAAPLVPVPQAGVVDVQWATSTFEALVPEMNPGAVAFLHYLYVDAAQGPLGVGTPMPDAGTPDVFLMSLLPGTPDLAVTATYGQFLPAGWSEFRSVTLQARVPVTAPGASRPRSFVVSSLGFEPMPANPIVAPTLSPISSPTLNGGNAFAPSSGVGSTPTFAWAPPRLGTADHYAVQIWSIWARADGGTTGYPFVTLLTTGTALTVPPGILQYGGSYVARISAVSQPGERIEAAPFRQSYAYARADALTGVFTP